MIKIISEKTKIIRKNKKKLEEALEVKIEIYGQEIAVEGTGDREYIAEKVIEAVDFGFSVERALMIRKEDFLFEVLDMKDYTRKKDAKTIRARIIGTKGKTLKTLSNLTECNFELNENRIGILGPPECIKNAQEGVISIIRGAKQSNVYAFLEKHRVHPVLDFALKPVEKRKNKKK